MSTAPNQFSIQGKGLLGRPLYLDLQATTPLDPRCVPTVPSLLSKQSFHHIHMRRVLDAMLPYMTSMYGNPHSKTHSYGWETELAVERAREHIAKLLHADEKEVIFTSGATESNNMAIKGVAHFYRSKKKHVVTLTTEHKCVLDSCRALESEGFEVLLQLMLMHHYRRS